MEIDQLICSKCGTTYHEPSIDTRTTVRFMNICPQCSNTSAENAYDGGSYNQTITVIKPVKRSAEVIRKIDQYIDELLNDE